MPYIKLADRPMFDTMIDGLVPKIRGFDRAAMAKVVGSLVINALTPTPCAIGPGLLVNDIIKALTKRIQTRGQANYCVCRILLEGMKPETGWTYHSLSDVIMAGDAAINLVYDVQRETELEDADVIDAVSVLGDAVIEIERRLLGPYEDTAILKNGDLACFANEDFVLKPFGLGLGLNVRETCECVLPCRCAKPEGEPILDAFDLSVIKGVGPMPSIIKALTQAQCDDTDRERQSHE